MRNMGTIPYAVAELYSCGVRDLLQFTINQETVGPLPIPEKMQFVDQKIQSPSPSLNLKLAVNMGSKVAKRLFC
jgi:hypothetical protein